MLSDMIKLIVLIAFVAKCLGLSHDYELKEKWEHFLKLMNISYDPWETHKRYSIFTKNMESIEAHNRRYQRGEETFEMGIGPFADKTEEEFMMRFDKHQGPCKRSFENVETRSIPREHNMSVPDQVDYSHNMPPVKDQGICKAGWAFAAVGCIEGIAAVRYKWRPVPLSEQNIIDCAYGNDYLSYGCEGGSIWGALFYTNMYGADSSRTYPYTAKHSKCQLEHDVALKVISIIRVKYNEQELRKTVGLVGPVATTIRVSPTIMHYKRGVVFDPLCGRSITNHAVTIVGYGMEKGYQYWLLRNSWGPNWGDGGYFKVARNHKNDCHIGQAAFSVDLDL